MDVGTAVGTAEAFAVGEGVGSASSHADMEKVKRTKRQHKQDWQWARDHRRPHLRLQLSVSTGIELGSPEVPRDLSQWKANSPQHTRGEWDVNSSVHFRRVEGQEMERTGIDVRLKERHPPPSG